jgi:integrase
MGKIYKRKGSPYWYIRIGTKRYSTNTTSKIRAEDLLHRKELERWQGRHNTVDNTGHSLDNFFSQYLEWIATNRRPETLKSYRSIVNTFAVFLLSRSTVKRVAEITPLLIEEYKIYRRKRVKSCTVNNDIKDIKAMLNKAKDWGYLYNNPAKKVEYVEITDSKTIRCITEDEYRRFMDVCKADFKEYYSIFYTFVHTGMRRGEILGLEWQDIDFKSGSIHIRSNKDFKPKGVDGKTKRAKTRIIPIHDSLKKMLYAIRGTSGKVFTYHGSPYSDNRLRRILMQIANKAGIKGLTRLHELRHSYATFLVKHGVDIYKVKELLGHSDIRDTMKYAHMPTEFMKEDVKKLEVLDD